MPVPTAITDLSTTAASNSPPGTESAKGNIDDYLRAGFAFTKQLYSSTVAPAESTIASATSVAIGAATTPNVIISGTTAITAFDTVDAGIVRNVRYSGAVPVTHNATSMILLGEASRTHVAGDCATFLSLGSGNWKEIKFSPIGALPVANGGTGGVTAAAARTALGIPNIAGDTFTGNVNLPSLNGGPLAGFRDKLIGGNFTRNPWQRGTSFTVTTSGTYVADRWRVDFDGSANITVDKVALAIPQVINGQWCSFGLRFLVNSKSGNTFIRLSQRIEFVDTLTTLPATVQTAIQGSASFSVPVNARQHFGTGGTPSADVITPLSNSLAVTSSLQLLATGLTVPTISGKTLGTAGNDFLGVEYDLMAVPATGHVIIPIAGIEPGTSATPFESRLPGPERALCQRYYELAGAGCTGSSRNVANQGLSVPFKVSKRSSSPSISLRSNMTLVIAGVGAFTATSVDSFTATDSGAFVNLITTTAPSSNGLAIAVEDSVNRIAISTEL
jgi:hypothetical protein